MIYDTKYILYTVQVQQYSIILLVCVCVCDGHHHHHPNSSSTLPVCVTLNHHPPVCVTRRHHCCNLYYKKKYIETHIQRQEDYDSCVRISSYNTYNGRDSQNDKHNNPTRTQSLSINQNRSCRSDENHEEHPHTNPIQQYV